MLQRRVGSFWWRYSFRWFEKFQIGDFNLSCLIDHDSAKIMIKQKRFVTASKFVEWVDSAQQTISDHIQKLASVWKYSTWLNEKNLSGPFIICTFLLTRIKIEPFLDRIITRDEKSISYENIIRQRAYCENGTHAPPPQKRVR